MTPIRLTLLRPKDSTDGYTWIYPDHIVTLTRVTQESTLVALRNGTYIAVTETVAHIISAVDHNHQHRRH